MNNQFFFALCCAILFYLPYCHTKGNPFYDFELFRHTEVWGLAQASMRRDTAKMARILSNGRIDVNFQEAKHGYSVLMVAAHYQMAPEVEVLLRHGADPNIQSYYDGTSAIMFASGMGPDYEDDPEVLSLMLQYGGDPSHPQGGDRPEGMYTRKTPLKIAVSCCLEKVRLLVRAGADVNYADEFGSSVLNAATGRATPEAPAIVKYLVMETIIDFSAPLMVTIRGNDTIYIENKLRYWNYPLGSEQHKIKMEVVEHIKSFGRDYYKAPIPKNIQNNYSAEYLEAY